MRRAFAMVAGGLLLLPACGLDTTGLGAAVGSDAAAHLDATSSVADGSSESSSDSSGGSPEAGSTGSPDGATNDGGLDAAMEIDAATDGSPVSPQDGGGTCTLPTDCPMGMACSGGKCSTSCSASSICNGGCCSSGSCVTDCSNAPEGNQCKIGVCGCNVDGDCGNSSWGGNCQSGTCGCSFGCFCCPNLTTCFNNSRCQ